MQSGNSAEATLSVLHVSQLPKLLHAMPFEQNSELTECVVYQFPLDKHFTLY